MSAISKVSTVSKDNRNPAVALSPDGSKVYVVWDGIVEGRRRILLREMVGEQWLSTVVVDANPAGNNSSPTIAIDATGTVHIAWVSSSGGKRSPRYARRLGRELNAWHYQDIPFPSEAQPVSNCDFVNLQLDAEGRPWLAWQHGYGNVYNVAVSHFNPSGEMVTHDLTPGSATHNLYPELFFLPNPTLYWYMWESDQFYLIGSKYDATTSEWKLTLPEDFGLVPAGNLPDLFLTEKGPLGAIWYDRSASDNFAKSDRVFLGLQGKESQGRGEAIDAGNGSSNDSVAAANAADKLVTAWISEAYETGTQVILGVGNFPDTVQPIPVSEATETRTSNPKVASVRNTAVITWEQESAEGATDTSVMLRRVELD